MVSEIVVIVTVIYLLAILSVLFVYASRYKRVAPDKAMVVYGRQMGPGIKIGYKMITGGGKFILPIIEETRFMDLGLKDMVLEVDDLRTDPKGEALSVRLKVVALYRVSGKPDALRMACEHLLEKTPEDIKRMTKVMIEGHLRGIVATMTAQDLDVRQDEVERVFQVQAAIDLLNVGIEVLTMRIIDVHVKGGS